MDKTTSSDDCLVVPDASGAEGADNEEELAELYCH